MPCTCVTFSIFQSALPRRERLKDSINQCPEVRISIRAPAKGATHQPWISRLRQYISIRAPAKGATVDAIHAVLYCIISIRAPAKGATGHARKQFCHIFYFNPRSREGSDTQIMCHCRIDPDYFNPRSREGSDMFPEPTLLNHLLFQSALPRRERQQYYTTIFIFLYNTVYFVSNNIK